MMTTGERTIVTHVHSDFGENAGCGIASNPRNRTSEFHLLLVRRQFFPNVLVEFFDHLFDKVHMFQSLPDPHAMMITHAVSFKGFHNLGHFPAQGSPRQVGHLFRIELVFQ